MIVSFDDFTYQSKVLHENHRGAGVVLKLANGDVAKCFVSKGFIHGYKARFYLVKGTAPQALRRSVIGNWAAHSTPIEIVHFSKPCLYEWCLHTELRRRAKLLYRMLCR